MAETGALIDAHDEPVAPAIAWHDRRGGDEAATLGRELGDERFSVTTGLPASPSAPSRSTVGCARTIRLPRAVPAG